MSLQEKRSNKEILLGQPRPAKSGGDSARAIGYLDGVADREIWSMFKKGHEGAFNHIYTQYFSVLFKYGFKFTMDREIIKDSIHDIFVEFRKSGEALADTDSIRYYLYKSLRWKIIQYLKKRQRDLNLKDKVNYFQVAIKISQEAKIINQQIDHEQRRKLSLALDKLTVRQREAITYFYNECLTYKEIAKIMEMKNVKSARSLIYRAIDSLSSDPIFKGFFISLTFVMMHIFLGF